MIVRAEFAHLEAIACAVSKQDADELRRVYGMSVAESLRRNMAASLETWTMFAGEEALAIFGVAPVSVMERRGEFWIVATSRICRHRLAFARQCKAFLPRLLSAWDEMACVLEHERADVVRWASWLGARITPINSTLSVMQLCPQPQE